MAHYLVELPHTDEECLKGLDEIAKNGKEALKDVVWGCKAGIHNGWALVKAKSEQEVRDKIASPTMLKKARVIAVEHYTVKDIAGFHKA